MSREQALKEAIENVLGTSFSERDGRVVPSTADITNTQAVKLEGVFLYADLAGSASLAQHCHWDTTAKVIRAFLDCSSRVIRFHGGTIRSFDGDRVMAVFIGDNKNTSATKCAREIFYCVDRILQPKASSRFRSISTAGIKIRCCVGVDRSVSRAVRAGIRSSNDLIWIGRAPSMAAKLSDIRSYPHCVYIHKDVYNRLSAEEKHPNGVAIWEIRTFKFAGEEHSVYRTRYVKTP